MWFADKNNNNYYNYFLLAKTEDTNKAQTKLQR